MYNLFILCYNVCCSNDNPVECRNAYKLEPDPIENVDGR
ncbi:hypothetical protein [Salmonella phage SD-2_S15]|nr:hypothetical protein [Salmonella phage SD-2_S15]